MTKMRGRVPAVVVATAASLWCLVALPTRASAAIVVTGSVAGLPPSVGFVADCPTWSASGDLAWLRFWARNDDQTQSPRDLLLVRGATYLIDVHTVEDLPDGGCLTIDDSAPGGRTRTRMVDEDYPFWEAPIPENQGFYVNGSGPTYTSWRLDDREHPYDINGWRYHERLDPGVLYLDDIARWSWENYSGLTSLVTISP